MKFTLMLIADVHLEVEEFLFTYKAPQHRNYPRVVDFFPGDYEPRGNNY